MLTAKECLAKALECEELAGRLPAGSGADGMIEAAAIWRRLATGELRPRTKLVADGSSGIGEDVALDDDKQSRNPKAKS